MSEDLEQTKQDFAKLKSKMTDTVYANKIFDLKKNVQVYMFGGYNSKGKFYDNHLRRLKFTSHSGKLIFKKIPVKGLYTPKARIGHCLEFYFPSQMLLLSGGQSRQGKFLNNLDIFDLISHSWQAVEVENTMLSLPRAHHSIGILNQEIYIFGGINSEGYLSGSVMSFGIENMAFPLRPKFLI